MVLPMNARALSLFLFVPSLSASFAFDWPQFRGPLGQGHAPGATVPTEWSAEKAVAWKVPVGGKAWSSPVIAGGTIYLTTAVTDDDGLSLRAQARSLKDGKLLWDREVFQRDDEGGFHKKNSHASPTPIIDTETGRLFVHFGHHGTACLYPSGKILWKQESLSYPPVHGNGGSPILHDGKLYFSCDGKTDPFMVALAADSGKVAWKVPRAVDVSRPFSFSTPLAIQVGDSWQIVSPGSGAVISYAPDTGKELWRFDYDEGYSVVPRPLYAHGLVYVCSGFNTASLFAIDPTGAGDVTKTHLRWKVDKRVPKESSPIIVGDHLYMNDDKGIATCLDARTGEQVWQKRLDGSGGYSASPVHAGGHLYFHNGDGITTVIKPATSFEEVAENSLGAYGLSSFAVTPDSFVVRTEGHLWRLRD